MLRIKCVPYHMNIHGFFEDRLGLVAAQDRCRAANAARFHFQNVMRHDGLCVYMFQGLGFQGFED